MKVKNRGVWIVLFTMPCMILFAIVYAAPIITVLYTSFCNYTTFSGPEFAGLKNFTQIFGDLGSTASCTAGYKDASQNPEVATPARKAAHNLAERRNEATDFHRLR